MRAWESNVYILDYRLFIKISMVNCDIRDKISKHAPYLFLSIVVLKYVQCMYVYN
jgi:hypothetical protein